MAHDFLVAVLASFFIDADLPLYENAWVLTWIPTLSIQGRNAVLDKSTAH